MTTPLVEFIVQRRLDRERFREEKKDERRRKDFEKKKQRELERLNKKREGKKKDDKMPTSAKGKRDDDQPPTNPIKVIFIEFVGEKNTVLSFLFFFNRFSRIRNALLLLLPPRNMLVLLLKKVPLQKSLRIDQNLREHSTTNRKKKCSESQDRK